MKSIFLKDNKNNRHKFLLATLLLIIMSGFLFFAHRKLVHAQTGQEGNIAGSTYHNLEELAAASSSDEDACGTLTLFSPSNWIPCTLLAVSRFVGYILSASATLFGRMVDVRYLSWIIGNPAVYVIWEKVRDLLNIGFILVLLFSAFSTIFQVERYSYKKILLRLIIMALLVNFSFPITRFIIDIANSLMYTLIQFLFSGQGNNPTIVSVFPNVADNSNLSVGLSAAQKNVSGLLASIIFSFILAVSLLSIGIMLAIRTLALTILIIFSPVAFIGAILPGAGGGLAGKWWDNLFRYAFFGPLMIFMIYVSVEIMKLANSTDSFRTVWLQAAAQQSNAPNSVAAIAFMAIPIILLWMSMGIAQSMSIAGAGTITSTAKKWGMAGGKYIALAPGRAAWWGMKKTGVPGGAKKTWQELKTRGPLGSDAVAKREARVAGLLSLDAVIRDMKSRSKKYDDDKEHSDNLKSKCAAGDAAACDRLVQRGDMNTETWGRFLKTNPNQKVVDSLTKDLKKNRLDILIKHKWQNSADMNVRVQNIIKQRPNRISELRSANPSWTEDQARTRLETEARAKAQYDVAFEEFGKLGPEKWNDQYWKDIIDENKNNIEIMKALEDSFKALDKEARPEVLKRLNANNASALRGQNII